jgi:PAS domain S-box-containing protein
MHFKTPRSVSLVLILLILVVMSVTVYSISKETNSALKESVQDKLMSVAGVVASDIDGDTFSQLHAGDENSQEFIRIRDQLHENKITSPDIVYIYTMRKIGNNVEFVVDGDYGYTPDSVAIGEKYPEATSDLLEGFIRPSADAEFTTDPWGTFLSGYSPIRNSDGAVVGIVGVDMKSTVVMAKLDRINLILYFVGIIAMSFVAIGIIVVERRRAQEERKLGESEKKYRLLFERAQDAILMLEAEGKEQGKIIAANSAAATMHGYTVKEMLTKTISDLDMPESGTSLPEHFAHLLNDEQLTAEVTHVRKDGTEFSLEMNASLIDLGTKKFILEIDRDITERKKAEGALQQVTKKLTLLNSVTFNDIQNAVFSLNGYFSLEKTSDGSTNSKKYLDREEESIKKILTALNFAKNYQDLGITPPQWQNVRQSFILGISHLDFSSVQRSVFLEDLEIYADSLLERVFFTLADNVLKHAKTATKVTIGYQFANNGLILFFADNGNGIPDAIKEKIFDRGFGSQKGMELFLVREILSITGITIHETGIMGKGARFEMFVPNGAFRFPDKKDPEQ